MAMKTAVLGAVLFLFGSAVIAAAQDVTLTSRDGRIEIMGALMGYDGEFYRLDTIYGELTIDGSGVTCEGPGCPQLEDFVAELSISGSATMGSVLMPALVEGFAQRNGYEAQRETLDATHFNYSLTDPGTSKRAAVFRFRITTTDEGFADLLANEADVVMSLREITADEKQRAYEAGMGDMTDQNRSRVLALDAILPIVSPQNPVQEISPLDLALSFAGEIDNWALLGGPDAPISVYAPDAQTGLAQAANDGILSPADLGMSDDVIRVTGGDAMAVAVASDPFALGLASFAEIGNAQPLVLKGTCGGVLRATRRSIKTEDYPLTAPMFLYTPARRLPKVAREFLAFAQSSAAQAVIRRSGFVDQAPEEVPITQQGDRLANAIAAAGAEIPLSELQRIVQRLGGMKRLTTSFRFEAGSARLDAQSRSNVVQLAHDLEQGRFDARQMIFVGFSDGQGSAEANMEIALSRANSVADAVRTKAETADLMQIDMQVDAFGEAMPLACDDSVWGRQANRRVEVWVR